MPPEEQASSALTLRDPWRSFLDDLDVMLEEPVDLHCIGGFVVSQCHGFARETADLDVVTVIPLAAAARVAAVAGRGSPLHRKHRVYVDHAAVANYPEDYAARLLRVFPRWANARLWALEPHDLALTKLERSNDRDIRDVMFLAHAGLINPETLTTRFEQELEPYLTGRTPGWHRSTLRMWLDGCWPQPLT